MTEEQAKKKWCPMLYPSAVQMATMLGKEHIEATLAAGKCQGTGCMMWRRLSFKVPREGLQPGQLYNEENFFEDKVSDTEGYCGLAGKP